MFVINSIAFRVDNAAASRSAVCIRSRGETLRQCRAEISNNYVRRRIENFSHGVYLTTLCNDNNDARCRMSRRCRNFDAQALISKGLKNDGLHAERRTTAPVERVEGGRGTRLPPNGRR